MHSLLKAAIGTALGLLTLTAPASAQFLTFVSAAGNDANTCFVQANPCKTLQRAINQTSAGGEARLLTSLVSHGFINKSITIEGGRNTVIGTISVDSASAIVRFRRLNLNGRHAFASGFDLINASAVHIEDCSVERYTAFGIRVRDAVPEISVVNTVIRDGNRGLVAHSSTTRVTTDNSRFVNNSLGFYLERAKGVLTRSIVFGNDGGVTLSSATLNATDTIAFANDYGFLALDFARVTLESCFAAANADGLAVEAYALARISNCVFSDNSDDGVDTDDVDPEPIFIEAITLTLGDNLIAGNGDSNVEGSLTPLAPE
jgi:hypothetical protein